MRQIFSSLRDIATYRTIRIYLLGSFGSNVGTWIQRVVVGWLVFDFTSSAAWVGVIAAAEVLPMLLVSPIAGALLDRGDRILYFGVCQVLALVQALMLTALALLGMLDLWWLLIAAAMLGTIEGVGNPARLSLVADIAPRRLIRSTVSASSMGFNLARFVGPALGGIILITFEPAVAFAINALTFLPLIRLLFVLRRQEAAPVRAPSGEARGIVAGVVHVARHPLLGPTFLILISTSLCLRALIDLVPAVAGLWFGNDPGILAQLTSCLGLGAMGGGLWMMGRQGLAGVTASVLTMPGVTIIAVTILALAGPNVWAAYPLLMVVGFSIVANAIGIQSLIHLTINPAYLGRAMSLFFSANRAFPALGAISIGFLADRIGLTVSLLIASCLALLVWFPLWLRRNAISAHLPPEDEIQLDAEQAAQ